ncbi:hypothetical protein LZ30DRAFT_304593 [Colletotrichum cereale]|nr:hypothetical protein LZ30DRAFT_304593 [Colletotrichum cereale]
MLHPSRGHVFIHAWSEFDAPSSTWDVGDTQSRHDSLECAYLHRNNVVVSLSSSPFSHPGSEGGRRNKISTHPPRTRKTYTTRIQVRIGKVVLCISRLRSQEPNQGRAPGPSHPPIRVHHRSHNPGNRTCGEQPTEPPICLASLQSHTVVCWCRLTSPSPPTTRYRRRTAAAAGAHWCSHTVKSMFHPPSLASQDAMPSQCQTACFWSWRKRRHDKHHLLLRSIAHGMIFFCTPISSIAESFSPWPEMQPSRDCDVFSSVHSSLP